MEAGVEHQHTTAACSYDTWSLRLAVCLPLSLMPRTKKSLLLALLDGYLLVMNSTTGRRQAAAGWSRCPGAAAGEHSSAAAGGGAHQADAAGESQGG
jgi:hypothetical protein